MDQAPTSHVEKEQRHAQRIRMMAKTLGVDLDKLLQQKDISSEMVQSWTVRCMGCLHPETCDHWLGKRSAGADATPFFCRNTTVLDALVREYGGDELNHLEPESVISQQIKSHDKEVHGRYDHLDLDDQRLMLIIRQLCAEADSKLAG